MTTKPSWIECNRHQSTRDTDRPNEPLIVRIRADFVTMIIETLTKTTSGKYIPGVRIHLGNNNYVDVRDETVDSVWNKLAQATGSNMPLIAASSPDYPGHPDYGKKEAA